MGYESELRGKKDKRFNIKSYISKTLFRIKICKYML